MSMTATVDECAAPDGHTEAAPSDVNATGIDPERLALCLAVIAEAEALDPEHPDAVAVRRATAGLFKTVKLRRRRDRRDAVLENDRAVTPATATGAPTRIDDETAGLALTTAATGRVAGTLKQPRGC